MAFVEIKNLKFSYPQCESRALNGVDLLVNEGEICLLIGKSGSGKSTMLRLLKKEIAPHGEISGEIHIKTDNIGFVNQNVESNIVMDTVQGELAFAPQNLGRSKKETALKLAETASYFNLGAIFNQKTASLSGGSKQIVSLAAVFAAKTDLLILDEPVSQLDPIAADEFIQIAARLNREQGTTVLISSHRTEHILTIADKIAVMEKGSIIFCGPPADAAHFLVEENHEMKLALPQYTQVFQGNPIDFVSAKRAVSALRYKACVPSCKMDASLVVKGLCFTYERKLPDVFYKLDYEAEHGKINAVIGANGSGKTTLLKCLCGVLKSYGGKIKTKGKAAYMPQNVHTLFLKDTVFQEIGDMKLLERFNLEKLAQKNPFDLSGGEAQRLALAKMMTVQCDVLLLDEPTKSVDAPFAACFAEMLRTLADEGKTIVFATHDLEFAARYADNAAFLFNGKIAASAPVKEVFSALDIYTTSIAKLTGGKAVSAKEIEVAE